MVDFGYAITKPEIRSETMGEKNKRNVPKKGAAKKWSERLKELGQQKPPQDIVDRLNGVKDIEKKIASPRSTPKDAEV
jgi:hypothetical protein